MKRKRKFNRECRLKPKAVRKHERKVKRRLCDGIRPPGPGQCMTERCRRPAVQMGLCERCFSVAKLHVASGVTTWEELGAMGLVYDGMHCRSYHGDFCDAYRAARKKRAAEQERQKEYVEKAAAAKAEELKKWPFDTRPYNDVAREIILEIERRATTIQCEVTEPFSNPDEENTVD